MEWRGETEVVAVEAARYNVDPLFVLAIRVAEGGRPGREFGVLSQSAPTYLDQLRACCATVRHRLAAYVGNPLVVVPGSDGVRRVRYSDAWVQAFATVWAPVGAGNDPEGLNANWFRNVRRLYGVLIKNGVGRQPGAK